MKQLFIILTLLFSLGLDVTGQKPFDKIHLGMSRREIMAQGSLENGIVTVANREFLLDILGSIYSSTSKYDGNGLLMELKLVHSVGYSRNQYSKSDINSVSEFEADIKELIAFFNKNYGKPIELVGYLNPQKLGFKKMAKIGVWKNGDSKIELWENFISDKAYPLIILAKNTSDI
jgi:hypothetical protein